MGAVEVNDAIRGDRVSRSSDISEWMAFWWLTYAATPNSTALPWKRSALAIEDVETTRNVEYSIDISLPA